MTRYSGQQLAPGSRIAVIANDAIGNFVVVTPLLRMLRDRWRPAVLDYYGGTRTWELQRASRLVDETECLLGVDPRTAVTFAMSRLPYDLVVNVEAAEWARAAAAILAGRTGLVIGPCLGEGGRSDLPHANDPQGRLWADPCWARESLPTEYPILKTGFIGEILCRLAYLEGAIPPYDVPSAEPPQRAVDVAISASASLPDKLWSDDAWRFALRALRDKGFRLGLVGAAPATQHQHWQGASLEETLVHEGLVQDLRGQLTLPEVVGLLASVRAALTLDNGIMHLAVAVQTRTVALFRVGIHRLWAPRVSCLTVLTGDPVCDIPPERVLEALDGLS